MSEDQIKTQQEQSLQWALKLAEQWGLEPSNAYYLRCLLSLKKWSLALDAKGDTSDEGHLWQAVFERNLKESQGQLAVSFTEIKWQPEREKWLKSDHLSLRGDEHLMQAIFTNSRWSLQQAFAMMKSGAVLEMTESAQVMWSNLVSDHLYQKKKPQLGVEVLKMSLSELGPQKAWSLNRMKQLISHVLKENRYAQMSFDGEEQVQFYAKAYATALWEGMDQSPHRDLFFKKEHESYHQLNTESEPTVDRLKDEIFQEVIEVLENWNSYSSMAWGKRVALHLMEIFIQSDVMPHLHFRRGEFVDWATGLLDSVSYGSRMMTGELSTHYLQVFNAHFKKRPPLKVEQNEVLFKKTITLMSQFKRHLTHPRPEDKRASDAALQDTLLIVWGQFPESHKLTMMNQMRDPIQRSQNFPDLKDETFGLMVALTQKQELQELLDIQTPGASSCVNGDSKRNKARL